MPITTSTESIFMKVSCPNCSKVLQAPDEWAGRKVKCPKCKSPITLPAGDPTGGRSDIGFDLGSLEAIESAGQPVMVEQKKRKPMTMKEAQAAEAAAKAGQEVGPTKADPTLRICPKCHQKARSEDLYSEIICRNCGAAIPGVSKVSDKGSYKTEFKSSREETTFYTGFTGALTYPIPALGSLAMAMLIALLVVAGPIVPILLFTGASSANTAVQEQADFGWVGVAVAVMFIIEAIYFGAVGYSVLIDTIRTTSSGSDAPPDLTWNPASMGLALAGYVALVCVYAGIAAAITMVTVGSLPATPAEWEKLLTPQNIGILALLLLPVPMNMIGLASGNVWDGLNPARFGKAIGKTIGHYIFLFLILVILLGIYVGALSLVVNWAFPYIMDAAQRDEEAGLVTVILKMLMGLGAWAILIGVAIYFAYSIGRILGLFSRSYRDQLEFEM